MCPLASYWSTFRTVLAFTITVSLLLASTVVWSVAVDAQGQRPERRTGKPRREKPEGELPDLGDVQQESALQREAPAAIPSTMRSPKVPLEPWNGRRVGDPEPQNGKDPLLRAHARRRFNPRSFNAPPPPVPDD